MHIERDGYPLIVSAVALTIALALAYQLTGATWLIVPSVVSGVLIFFFAYFFRSPHRTPPTDDTAIVSPADGRVVQAMTLSSYDGFSGPVNKVAIFLSPLNVHVNWTPCAGEVESVTHIPGAFKFAFVDKASDYNERTEVALKTQHGRVVFKQIAGMVARRIVCRLRPGDQVATGQKYGMIKFGSRVDIIFDAGFSTLVKVGDNVVGCSTILAQLSSQGRQRSASVSPTQFATEKQ